MTTPDGFHSITPYLTVRDASAAISFYENALGAIERNRMTTPDGLVANAEIVIGDSAILIRDETPDLSGPTTLGNSPVMIHLYVDDVDSISERAVRAGMEILLPVEDRFYGDRSGRFRDPYGHIWIISTRLEETT
ncbi:MAG: VOC family protein [Gammaproteobacteria bacterium]|nr:MAG: VOC family protein [Gammaproteobacteria bacterium]